MPETAHPACQSLTERIADWKTQEGWIDRENRLVKNVALTGTESKNGYRYSEQALKAGAPLYEHKPVFLDHAASPAQPHRRSTRDLVGSIVNVRYEAGRIKGDIRVIDTEAGRTFLALAESNGPAVGMSHVILAEKNAEGTIVEKIHEVVSVDAVVFPATTKSFQEQHASENESGGGTTSDLARERDQLQVEIASLKRERDQLRNVREVERLIEQAALPHHAVSDLFRDQLLKAASDSDRRAMIQERRALVDSLAKSSPSPSSRERLSSESASSAGLSDEQLIAAIKRPFGG